MGSKQIRNFIWGATLSYDEVQKDSFNIMEKKQTALQWFVDKLPHAIETQFSKQIQQALQLEREQIVKAHGNKKDYSFSQIDPGTISGEQYYIETYGSQK